MGNREDLLAGAIRCLRERGWARTTVRDIAAAAGVSHAAIGYHYGSREALLVAAVIGAMEEWGDELARALAADADPEAGPVARFEAQWGAMVRSFTGHRTMWLATIDAFVQSEHSPQLREQLAAGQHEGRRGATAGLLGVEESALTDDDVRTLGSVQMALIPGVMMQWLLDPEHAPAGADVVAGLRTLAGLIESPRAEVPFLHDATARSPDTGRMTTTTTSVPSVWPCVPYRDEPAALRFLTEAFGFTERSVYRDGDRLVHVELTWPGPDGTVAGGVMFGSIDEADADRSPYGRTSVHVVTDDPDGLHDRAVAAGAVLVRPLEDTDYGSRQFVVRDPEGNIWSFGTWYEK